MADNSDANAMMIATVLEQIRDTLWNIDESLRKLAACTHVREENNQRRTE